MNKKSTKNDDNLNISFEEVKIHKLRRIPVVGGDVQHYITKNDPGFIEFGEVYFSRADFMKIKAWKRHREVTLNLTVPVGEVKFVFWNEMKNTFREIVLGDHFYARLTVAPGIWFGFQGLSTPTSLVASLTDMTHKPDEVDRREKTDISFQW